MLHRFDRGLSQEVAFCIGKAGLSPSGVLNAAGLGFFRLPEAPIADFFAEMYVSLSRAIT
jgi:hypothetical protein